MGTAQDVDASEYSSNVARVVNRTGLNDILAKLIKQQDSTSLLPGLHNAKVPAGVIQNMREVFEMPEAQEILMQSAHLIGVKNFVASPEEWHAKHLLPPPRFGEHTEEILKRLLG